MCNYLHKEPHSFKVNARARVILISDKSLHICICLVSYIHIYGHLALVKLRKLVLEDMSRVGDCGQDGLISGHPRYLCITMYRIDGGNLWLPPTH